MTSKRNFDKVNFGHWQIKTWYVCLSQASLTVINCILYRYFSPYPLSESEQQEGVPTSSDPFKAARAADRKSLYGKHQSGRTHGRTADLLANGLSRENDSESSGHTTLWVCDRCFKYTTEGVLWEVHVVGLFKSLSSILIKSFSIRKIVNGLILPVEKSTNVVRM